MLGIIHAMTKRLFSWIAWLLCLGISIWLGFEKHWSGVAWLQLIVVLSSLPFSWIFGVWLPRRHFTSLSPEDRYRQLAAMSPARREEILHLIENHDA